MTGGPARDFRRSGRRGKSARKGARPGGHPGSIVGICSGFPRYLGLPGAAVDRELVDSVGVCRIGRFQLPKGDRPRPRGEGFRLPGGGQPTSQGQGRARLGGGGGTPGVWLRWNNKAATSKTSGSAVPITVSLRTCFGHRARWEEIVDGRHLFCGPAGPPSSAFGSQFTSCSNSRYIQFVRDGRCFP